MFIKKETYKDKLELIEIYRNKNKCNVDRINDYKVQISELRKKVNYFEKTQSQLYAENQKLTNWVINILKEFGTCEIGDRQHVEIPVHSKIRCAYNTGYMEVLEKERIEIPSITIVKLR